MRSSIDPITGLLRTKFGLAFVSRVRRALSRRLDNFQQSIAARMAPDQRVVGGPFAGMLYPISKIESSVVLPKLLGTYEEELHPHIQNAVRTGYQSIVDIGCGEGYYAVGLARCAPLARVIAFDIDSYALQAGRSLAELNGVASRVDFISGCSIEQLRELPVGSLTLILSDCEGAEFDLIHPKQLPHAAIVDMLIECHDCAASATMAEELERRFSATHTSEIIHSRPRDPSRYPILRGWRPGELELSLSESRPPGMKWLSLVQTNRTAVSA